MALYFYFNETTGDLVYSDKATYGGGGYTSLGEQEDTNPSAQISWIFDSKRASIKTVTKDSSLSDRINVLTSMTSMFCDCAALASLDLSGFDTSNVTDMRFMFRDCTALASLDLSGFDTSNVTDMAYMFDGCAALASLDISGFDTSNVTEMRFMFRNCPALTSLDLSCFDTSKATMTSSMFTGSEALRLITISDKMSNVLSQLPADQYYPASGGSPVAKADLTAGTWVRDEADLTKVTSIVQQAQMQQAINRRIGGIRRDLEATKSHVDGLVKLYTPFTSAGDLLEASGTVNHNGEPVAGPSINLTNIDKLGVVDVCGRRMFANLGQAAVKLIIGFSGSVRANPGDVFSFNVTATTPVVGYPQGIRMITTPFYSSSGVGGCLYFFVSDNTITISGMGTYTGSSGFSDISIDLIY